MVDANHAYSVPTAVSLAKQMEKFNISWFEEPVVPEEGDRVMWMQEIKILLV